MTSLVYHLLLPMRARQTPLVTPLSPRPNMQADVEDQYTHMMTYMDRLKILKTECLLRDQNMCTILKLREDATVLDPDAPKFTCSTQCAHIIPFSLSNWTSNARARERSAVWVTLRRCFPILDSLAVRFGHADINDYRNCLTMENMIYSVFGEFLFSFVPIADRVDEYSIKRWGRLGKLNYYLPEDITTVKFEQHGTQFDLPCPYFIMIHHIIAQILHASGRADFITKILADMDEEGSFLAEDGTSTLSEMLWASDLAYLGESYYGRIVDPI